MASYSSGSMIPGRSALKQRPVDPKHGQYERGRARDAYRKQLNIFKAKFEASLREFDKLDLDAKQAIRIRAKRQREICLKDYREGLQGLAKSSFRRTYKDVFLGERETQMDMYDPNVLEYELRLTSEMDTIIDNIRLLSVDKSNVGKMDWFSNLARAKFSYEFELQNDIDPDSLTTGLKNIPEDSRTTIEHDDDYLSDIHKASGCPGCSSAFDPPELSDVQSVGSSASYVYRPFSRRKNLYSRSEEGDDDKSDYSYQWQRLYDRRPERRRLPEYEDRESPVERYDYEPFQPFCDEPIGRRRNRYPTAHQDPEWASQSSLYSYHKPVQPTPRFQPDPESKINLDGLCPIGYGYGHMDDDTETVTSRGELMAGLDYEYKPIIPSYLRNGSKSSPSSSSRFNYDNLLQNDDDLDYQLKTSEGPRRQSRVIYEDEPDYEPPISIEPKRNTVRFDQTPSRSNMDQTEDFDEQN